MALERNHCSSLPSSYDEDLIWILEGFAGRIGADAGSLCFCRDDGERDRPLVSVGSENLLDGWASGPGPAAVPRNAGSDPVIEYLPSGARMLCLTFRIAENRILMANALFHAESSVADSAAIEAAGRLQPVLSGYFRLWSLHRAERRRTRGLESALHASGMGVLILDANTNLIFANLHAERLLTDGDGIRRKGKSIAATSLPDAIRFQVIVDHVISQHQVTEGLFDRRSPVLNLARPAGRPLLATILPARDRPVEQSDPAIIIYVMNPEMNVGALLAPLLRLYQLSPAEARLVIGLLEGDTITEAAAKLRISSQTARSYLKQIFIKTSTNRQADLIRVMLSSIMNLSNDFESYPVDNSDKLRTLYA